MRAWTHLGLANWHTEKTAAQPSSETVCQTTSTKSNERKEEEKTRSKGLENKNTYTKKNNTSLPLLLSLNEHEQFLSLRRPHRQPSCQLIVSTSSDSKRSNASKGLQPVFATSNRCIASSNKCLTSSNKKLLVTGASLVVTSALLVVTRSY